MQQENVKRKQFKYGRIEWAKAWLFCGVLSYLTSGIGFATDPPPPTHSFDALMQPSYATPATVLPYTNGAVSSHFIMTPLAGC
jgi:hypothetical protein